MNTYRLIMISVMFWVIQIAGMSYSVTNFMDNEYNTINTEFEYAVNDTSANQENQYAQQVGNSVESSRSVFKILKSLKYMYVLPDSSEAPSWASILYTLLAATLTFVNVIITILIFDKLFNKKQD